MTVPPPPPLPYQGGPAQPYPEPRRTKWWLVVSLVVGALVLLAVAIGAVVVVAVTDDSVTAAKVRLGDCLAEIPDGERVLRVTTVGCDQPHAGEVFAVLTIPDGEFPGQAAVEAYHEKCGPELQSYSPLSLTDDSVQLYVLYPTAETWADGDRTVSCIATLDPPRAGSLRG